MASFKQNLLCVVFLCLVMIVVVSMSRMFRYEAYIDDKMRDIEDTAWQQPNDQKILDEQAMDDEIVITLLRERHLVAPPPEGTPLKLREPKKKDTSMGQAKAIREILGDQKDGFYVECGALDGETRSNSLVFERTLNWKGLLIEADPKNFQMVLQKNRNAYLSQSCLSTKPYPITVSFRQQFNIGKISDVAPGQKRPGHVDVQCFPLYSYLLALNRTTVDYFSLDVEGNELEVLETIPFDKVNIRTLSVEYIHGVKGKEALRAFMEGKGYKVWGEVTNSQGLANDFIFYK